MIAALELDRRLARAWEALGYLAASVPIALLAIPALLGLVVGAALSAVAVGVPLLRAGAATCRRLVRLDRRAANRFLGTQIPPVPGSVRPAGGPMGMVSDRALWRIAAHLALKPALVAGLIAAVAVPLVLLAALLQLGVSGLAGGGVDYVGPWKLGPGLGVVLCALALPAAVLLVAALDGAGAGLATIAGAFLAPRAPVGGPVREMLAESLGDRSVAIAYWLPERERFVDETGRPVELPAAGSGRAWTAVERDGRPVAAIIHDAALDTSRELVQAAASASSLAIDNERLKADLRARVEELRESRARIVEAGYAARRRIERDLHDGAQQQLVTLALELRLLKARVKDPDAVPLIDELSERLASALAELRELARGIHPAVLAEHGLAPAIGALAERSSVPIACDVAVEGRLPSAVEAAAYFLVAEGLTNVARYAQASSARVDVRRRGDELMVLVADDGIGGADVDTGSGLRGIADRLAAIGGTLTLDSPPRGGTRLRGTIPIPPGKASPEEGAGRGAQGAAPGPQPAAGAPAAHDPLTGDPEPAAEAG